jgi:serine/threonine-protein kinase
MAPDETLAAVRTQLDADLGGAYHVVRLLGRGAFGAVYLARDRALHRHVAIKVLRLERAANETERNRFRVEARTAALLDHPNIAPILSFAETPTTLYMVMPYIGGESLARRLEKAGRLPPALVRHVLREVALALAHAHRVGIVHRDLKPENVLLTEGDEMATRRDDRVLPRVRLVDFGIAAFPYRDPGAGARRDHGGTPNFMSPEQALGESELGPRSDVYALGVLGYLLLAGRLPFTGSSLTARVAEQRAGPPVPLSRAASRCPTDLVVAIDRCLEFDPSKRWRSVRELHAALSTDPAWQRWSPRTFAARVVAKLRAIRVGDREWDGGPRFVAVDSAPDAESTSDEGGASQAGFDPNASQAGFEKPSASQPSGDVLQAPKSRSPWREG